jgi:hypothetical protein
MRSVNAALIAAMLAFLPAAGPAGTATTPSPNGPVGWETYRHLDHLPEIPSHVQEYEISSYDRSGGNDDGFNGTYSCLSVGPDGCLIADHSGPGEIDSIWFTRDGGNVTATGNIKIVLDGRTVLDAPLQSVVNGDLGAPFAYPLVANADQSSGGVYIKVPMPFRSQMRVTTDQNPRFYHVFYRTYGTAREVQTFDPSVRALGALSVIDGAGYLDPKPFQPAARTVKSSFQLAPGRTATVATLPGPGDISTLQLRIPELTPGSPTSVAAVDILRKVHLRITFDGHRTVDSPLGEFFGTGLGDFPVRALMFANDTAPNGWLTSWWPMPYRFRAQVQLVNLSGQTLTAARSSVTWARSRSWGRELSTRRAGYFSATSHAGPTTPGVDWPFLQAFGAGKLVGVAQTMDGPDRTYLEGDDIGFIDGSVYPQLHGTGTEDFYEGGWYWNRGPFTDPLNGEPSHEQGTYGCAAVCDSAYRLMIAESVPFTSSIDYGIEHGNQNTVQAIDSSTAFWYQRPNR